MPGPYRAPIWRVSARQNVRMQYVVSDSHSERRMVELEDFVSDSHSRATQKICLRFCGYMLAPEHAAQSGWATLHKSIAMLSEMASAGKKHRSLGATREL